MSFCLLSVCHLSGATSYSLRPHNDFMNLLFTDLTAKELELDATIGMWGLDSKLGICDFQTCFVLASSCHKCVYIF